MKNNGSKREQKRAAILAGARNVFSRQGFIDVTMKDIIEEVGISRGGIYLYFDSVDAIFIETIKERNTRRFDDIREKITAGVPFEELLADYLASHKQRLLSTIEDSMLRAMYEYYFTHKTEADRKFQHAQLAETKETILAIFRVGVTQEVLVNQNLEALAENFMFVIEGLGILALTGGVDEQRITTQFAIMESLLPRKDKKTDVVSRF